MNLLELRGMVGSRTYEAGKRLLMKGTVTLERKVDDRLMLYKVKDGTSKNVVVWNRNGNITVECECTPKEMGCRHCVTVRMFMMDDEKTDEMDVIRNSISELASISFDPADYLDNAPRNILMTGFYDFIQKKIDKRVANICKAIDEFSDGGERTELYRMLWKATDGYPSPHDEWSKDTIASEGDVDFWDE